MEKEIHGTVWANHISGFQMFKMIIIWRSSIDNSTNSRIINSKDIIMWVQVFILTRVLKRTTFPLLYEQRGAFIPSV